MVEVMTFVAVALFVLARDPGPRIDSFAPLLTGLIVTTQFMSAFLVLGQFARLRTLRLLLIGGAYLYSACLAVPYILTLPNAFGPAGAVVSTSQTAIALWIVWHAGFPILVGAGVLASRRPGGVLAEQSRTLFIASAAVASVLFAVNATVAFSWLGAALPPFVVDGIYTTAATAFVLPALCLFHALALAALAGRSRSYTVARLWLTVTVVASLLDSVTGLICEQYSFGWYAGKLFSLVASSVIAMAFIHEVTAFQRRLANANDELLNLNAKERLAARERLVQLAYHDQLTGLLNRSRWETRLDQTVKDALTLGTTFALFFIDLDRFKEINDSTGHAMGDRVLVEAADRLRRALGPADIIGRFGGDEFVVLTNGNAEEASTLARVLRDSIRRPFEFGERSFHLSASVGIALFPSDSTSSGALLNHADAACYHAKRSGGDCERFYDKGIGEELRHRREIYEALVIAIEEGDFMLYYQPMYDLRTRRVEGVEALIRWRDRNGTFVPPATFIPIAEQSGLMHSIGRWVLNEALMQARRWVDGGHSLRVAVNVSAHALQADDFFDYLRCAVDAARVDPALLEVEVTESAALADPVVGVEQLARCKALGIRVALDDFGTHYSSLTYLQRLPIDSIKIDRSFVRGLPFNSQDTAIVRAVITLGHDLGRTIVAEGVETIEQLRWLENAGCDVVQGYYIAKPMPAADLAEWLAEPPTQFATRALASRS